MRGIILFILLGLSLLLWLMIDAATPRQPEPSWFPITEIREMLNPEQCRIMAEHLRRDHALKVRVLAGTQMINGSFVWQDLTLELEEYPGLVFSLPHYLGNLNNQRSDR